MSLVFTLSACGGGDGGTGTTPPNGSAVASLRFDRDTVFVLTGGQLAVRASALRASGTPLSGISITYAVGAQSVATIDALGILRAVAPGSTTVTATAEGRSSVLVVYVHNAVATVAPSLSNLVLDVNESRTLSAVLRDAAGVAITAPLPVEWAVENVSVATISSRGQVTGQTTGNSVITLRFGNLLGNANIRVFSSASATRIAFGESEYGILAGQTRTISAVAYDGANVALPRAPQWSSNVPTIASISAEGQIVGLAAGQTALTATMGPTSAVTNLTVFPTMPAGNVGAALGDDQFVAIPAGGTVASPFRAQRTEVTQAQWLSMGVALPAGQSRTCNLCPVENVTTALAQQFIAALNAAQPGRGYRIPTAAEWELAARAGTTGAYHGPIELVAWYVTTRDDARTSLVGLRQPNAFGLYDVHGNVAELTTANVLPAKGGSWNLPAIGVQFIASNVLTPIVGLRLVRDP